MKDQFTDDEKYFDTKQACQVWVDMMNQANNTTLYRTAYDRRTRKWYIQKE